VSAHVRILPAAERPFALEAERVRLGVLPIPAILANLIIRHYDPSTRLASRLPVPVEIGGVTITPDALRISPR
jgi:hypothetical protein